MALKAKTFPLGKQGYKLGFSRARLTQSQAAEKVYISLLVAGKQNSHDIDDFEQGHK